MLKINCLNCNKEIEVEPPCFIQMCKECQDEINWGDKNGDNN
jgi:hypothetical protein